MGIKGCFTIGIAIGDDNVGMGNSGIRNKNIYMI